MYLVVHTYIYMVKGYNLSAASKTQRTTCSNVFIYFFTHSHVYIIYTFVLSRFCRLLERGMCSCTKNVQLSLLIRIVRERHRYDMGLALSWGPRLLRGMFQLIFMPCTCQGRAIYLSPMFSSPQVSEMLESDHSRTLHLGRASTCVDGCEAGAKGPFEG